MECKIGKRGAKWLGLALKEGADPSMPFSVVSVLKIGGRLWAGATDMHRLHVLELTETLEVGPYTLDVENGLLKPVTMAYGVAVLWATVVPHVSDLTRPGVEADQADIVNIGGNVCYRLLLDGTADVKCSFVDQALTGNYGYTIRCNCAEYGPIRIDLLQEQTARYAVLIPIRNKPISKMVRV